MDDISTNGSSSSSEDHGSEESDVEIEIEAIGIKSRIEIESEGQPYANEPLASEEWIATYNQKMMECAQLEKKLKYRLLGKKCDEW